MKIAARQAILALAFSAMPACTCGGGGGGDLADSRLAFVPEALDFGTVTVGVAAQVSLMLESTGRAELVISGARAGDNLAAEVQLGAVPARMAPQSTAIVTVTFLPKSPGTRDGEIAFMTNSRESPVVRIRVFGLAVQPKLIAEPPALDFGHVVIGRTASATVSIANAGDVPIMISGITPDVGTSPVFMAVLPASRTLGAGESFPVEIRYTPRQRTADDGRMVIADDTHASVRLGIDVHGEGVLSEIEVDPAGLDFDGLLVGERVTRTVAIRNLGTSVHAITRLALTSTAQEYSLVLAGTRVPFDIPAGGSRAFAVAFAPLDTRRHLDTVLIESTGLAHGIAVILQGSADLQPKPQISVSPSALSFGQVEAGTSSARRLTIQNLGLANLHLIGDLHLDPPDAPFSLVDVPAPNATLGPKDAHTVQVVYAPGTSASATLLIHSDDPSYPVLHVPLQGEAGASPIAHADLAPERVVFDRSPIGTESARSLVIASVGSAPLSILSAEWIDAAAGRLELAPSTVFPLLVMPAALAKISIELHDASARPGTASGLLRLHTNDPDRRAIDVPIDVEVAYPPVVPPAFAAELAWDLASADLDLHLVREGGAFFDLPSDACYCDPAPDWGLLGDAADDPHFERDAVSAASGDLAERITLASAGGRYQVIVHFFSDHGSGQTATATVSLRMNGAPIGTFARAIGAGMRWDVGTFDVSASSFTPIAGPLSSAVRAMCY